MSDEKLEILVVDDTPDNLSLISGVLKETYKVKVATSGERALAICAARAPALILLDIMMPEMDGIECLRHLREDPRYSQMPIIMMTALSDDDHQRRARELGANDYLVKARCSVNQMLDRIRRVIPGSNDLSN